LASHDRPADGILAKGIGMDVIVWTFHPTPSGPPRQVSALSPLNHLVSQADVISIHIPPLPKKLATF